MSNTFPATINKINKVDYKVYDEICNAISCNEKSSVKLDIDCGNFGDLTIYVCNNCVSKFKTVDY